MLNNYLHVGDGLQIFRAGHAHIQDRERFGWSKNWQNPKVNERHNGKKL